MPYADKEKQRAYYRKYQQTEKRKAYKAAWYQANKERAQAYSAKHRNKFPNGNSRYFRNHHLVKTYGINIEQYEAIYKVQRGVCAICGSMPDVSKHGFARLVVDHDHATGKIRGLLCNNCNRALGLMKDDEITIQKFLDYLARFRSSA